MMNATDLKAQVDAKFEEFRAQGIGMNRARKMAREAVAATLRTNTQPQPQEEKDTVTATENKADAAPAQISSDEARKAFTSLRKDLASIFYERDEAIEGILAAVIAGEHVYLHGPAGTGKSALARSVASAFQGRYFEILFSVSTKPDELFGPFSLKELESDRYIRKTEGRMPEAEIVFGDECWKADGGLSNTMLALLNERVFHNGGQVVKSPLVTFFGASNELPQDDSLAALWDRFMLRYKTDYCSRDSNFASMVVAAEPKAKVQLDMSVLRAAQAFASALPLAENVPAMLVGLRAELRTNEVVASDRRWKRSLKIARAFAWMDGATQVEVEHFAFLPDALWNEEGQRPKIARIVAQFTSSIRAKVNEVCEAASEMESRAKAEHGGNRVEFVRRQAGYLARFDEQVKALESLLHGASKTNTKAINEGIAKVQQSKQTVVALTAARMGI